MIEGMLRKIPLSNKNKEGWPWTKESKLLNSKIANEKIWPRISIITPSLNQGAVLEEAIRSVLLQNYPNLEYIIIDGGSTDNSVEIIKKYSPWITYWVTEKDNGQADAIHKGFTMASGDIWGWINADDFYLEDCLLNVGKYFHRHQTIDCVIGGTVLVDSHGDLIYSGKYPICDLGTRLTFHRLLYYHCGGFFQAATFWRKAAYSDIGGIDKNLFFCFDYDYFIRLTKHKRCGRIKKFIAAVRSHENRKTARYDHIRVIEDHKIWERYGRYLKSEKYLRWQSSLYKKYDLLEKYLLRLKLKFHMLKIP
jgi:glycosyltransferase involved in cell wall biosynthesis